MSVFAVLNLKIASCTFSLNRSVKDVGATSSCSPAAGEALCNFACATTVDDISPATITTRNACLTITAFPLSSPSTALAPLAGVFVDAVAAVDENAVAHNAYHEQHERGRN